MKFLFPLGISQDSFQKTIIVFNCVFLVIAVANLTIGLYNLRANSKVARHAKEINDKTQ